MNSSTAELLQALNEGVAANTGSIDTLTRQMAATEPSGLKALAQGAVKTINGKTPDEQGAMAIDKVRFSENFECNDAVQWLGDVTSPNGMRTTAGDASIGNGTAHADYFYGLSQKVNGTIVTSKPTAWTATGFNQFDKNTMVRNGKAWIPCVEANTSNYGYIVGAPTGVVASVGFSATLDGTVTPLSPYSYQDRATDGVTEAGWTNVNYLTGIGYGYLVVQASDYARLCVHVCWSGQAAWQMAGNADYEDFYSYTFQTPTKDANGNTLQWVTYGLMSIGDTRDELKLTGGTNAYVRKIDREAYSAERLAELVADGKVEGVDYDYDANYIYTVRATKETKTLATFTPNYTANDWGTETVTGTGAVQVRATYRVNLRDKLRNDVVAVYGNQEIAGYKTFVRTVNVLKKSSTTSNVVSLEIANEDMLSGEANPKGQAARVRFLGKNSTVAAMIHANEYSQQSGGAMYLFMSANKFNTTAQLSLSCRSDGERVALFDADRVSPNTAQAGTAHLGTAALKWADVYAVNGTIQTSDRRAKVNDRAFTDDELDAWGDVSLKVFQMKASVEKKGEDAARLHAGAIAQEIATAFAAHGLDADRYGLYCHDSWEAETDPETGAVTLPAGDLYSIRYDEFLVWEAAYQRRRMARIEARLAALENA